MPREEFKPKKLVDHIIGKSVWDMSEIIKEKIVDDEDRSLIKKALLHLFDLGFVLGMILGMGLFYVIYLLIILIRC